jgi:bacterioferritin-associated ferredoxin
MEKRKESFTVQADVSKVPYEKVENLCKKAKFHPEQLVCYCTATRAEEVAAAILLGADSAEKVSAATGIRSGCKVECIQPILRLLEAAGINPVPPEGGWQWYGRTKTVWDIPTEVKEKYSKRGFYFDDDIRLLDKVVEAKPSRRRD